jgi:hypothetical protein
MIAVTNDRRGASDQTIFRVPLFHSSGIPGYATDGERHSQTAGAAAANLQSLKLAFFRHRNISKNFLTHAQSHAQQRDRPTPISHRQSAGARQLQLRMNDL